MALGTRPIPEIECLDLKQAGDKIYHESTADPLGQTGWNELSRSINGVNQIGYTAFQQSSQFVNQFRIPVIGNYGGTFQEDATRFQDVNIEIAPGYDRVVLFGQINTTFLQPVSSTVSRQTITIQIGANVFFSSNILGVSDFYVDAIVPPGLLANPGVTRGLTMRMATAKLNPLLQTPGFVDYRDGIVALTIRFYKNCI